MRNKKIIKILALYTLLFSILLVKNVCAAGTFSLSKKSVTLTEGKTTTFLIEGDSCTGKVEISSSNTAVATVSSASEWLEKDSKTITITAKKAGNATITVSGTVADKEGEEGTITETIKVTVNRDKEENEEEKEEAKEEDKVENKEENKEDEKDKTTETKLNDDATLSTLGVTPKEYDFTGFKKTKTEYSVTIPNEVSSLNVAYKTTDSKAKVKITGNTNLEVGTNTIKVVVTAEDGKTKKTYTIKVTKLAAEEEKPGNIIDDGDDNENEIGLALDSLEIKGIELTPEFSSDVYSYEATVDMDSNDLKKLEITAQPNQYGAEVEISGNTNLVEGENLVNIIVKSDYLKEQVVYQIVINKVSQLSEIAPDNNYFIKKEHLIIGTFILSIILIVVLIYINYRKNKDIYRDEDNNEKEDENIEYSKFQNKNLVEELFNKKKVSENINNMDKETMEDIQKENDRIFKKNEDITTGVSKNTTQANQEDPFLRELRERRNKGKH